MSETKRTVYVTKYALSEGIICSDVIRDYGRGMLALRQQGLPSGSSIYTQKDWAPTATAALARAEEIRVAKIASLKKQIAKLEKLTFAIPHPVEG